MGSCLITTLFRHESVVRDIDHYQWNDSDWIENRKNMHLKPRPISIYEMYLPSWRKHGTESFSFRELVDKDNPNSLLNYLLNMGYTHVEFMGLKEHPQVLSWGYQVTGYFAPTHRLGSMEDFQYMIDVLHQNGIGAFLDFVPAHFALDPFALAEFDGTALYEHPDPRRGDHLTWGTKIFNYEDENIRNYVASGAYFWLEKMHLDGLRMDGVSSMLYLDFDRNDWLPNHKNGNLNLGAICFLKDLNSIIHKHLPGTIVMAEESTGFRNMTCSTKDKGFNFDAKWAMGWQFDLFEFLSFDYPKRNAGYDKLVHSFQNCENGEHLILALSHDEVAHGKKVLYEKMPGTIGQKFANVRLLIGDQFCRPGRKLTFMGNDLGQNEEWSFRLLRSYKNCVEAHLEAVQWDATDPEINPKTAVFGQGLQKMIRDLNHLYRKFPALWQKDGSPEELCWINKTDRFNQVVSYHRSDGQGQQLACVHNFSPNTIKDYIIYFDDQTASRMQQLSEMHEIFNSDAVCYAGSGAVNDQVDIIRNVEGKIIAFKILMPPLATLIFEETFKKTQ